MSKHLDLTTMKEEFQALGLAATKLFDAVCPYGEGRGPLSSFLSQLGEDRHPLEQVRVLTQAALMVQQVKLDLIASVTVFPGREYRELKLSEKGKKACRKFGDACRQVGNVIAVDRLMSLNGFYRAEMKFQLVRKRDALSDLLISLDAVGTGLWEFSDFFRNIAEKHSSLPVAK